MLPEIQALLERSGARRLSPGLPIWESKAPWWPFSRRAQGFEKTREELLDRALMLSGPAHLVTSENPQSFDRGGQWARAGERTWPIPLACRAADLLGGVLAEGGWCIYTSVPVLVAAAIPDAFAGSLERFAGFASSEVIPFLAQADDRNHAWRVFLESVDRRHVAAA